MNDTTQNQINEAPTENHVRVSVPSNCVFYSKDVSAIYVRPFHLGDINSMSTAKNANDIPSYIRAIGKTVSLPVESLTQDDFQAICYWHRVNSYPRKPLTLTWQCANPKHVALANKVLLDTATQEEKDAVEDAKAGLRNRKVMSTGDIKFESISRERFNAIGKFLKDPERHSRPYLLMPPTIADMIELAEITKVELRHKKINEMELNEENLEAVLDEITEMTADDVLVRVASMLAPLPEYGITLRERIDYINKQIELNPRQFNSEFLADIEEYEQLVAHGVIESVQTKCKYRGCEHPVEINLDFDLFNFFPDV